MYLDPNSLETYALVQQLKTNAQQKEYLDLIEAFKPVLSVDGDQYCFIYGNMPNECIVGFGETVQKAMVDFSRNFYSQKVNR